MSVCASWLYSSLRALVPAALLAAVWTIFGAAWAQASEPLPPLAGGVQEFASDETLLAPSLAGPLAPAAQQITDPVLVPFDAAGAPAVVEPVSSVIGQVVPVTEPIAGLASDALTPVTSTVSSVTAPLADVVLPAMAVPLPATTKDTLMPAVAAALPEHSGAGAAVDVAVDEIAPSPALSGGTPAGTDADTVPAPRPGVAALAVTTAAGSLPGMQAPIPSPGLPAAPGPGSPATAPAGAGSSFRAASDAGSASADKLAGFRLSLPESSLAEVLRRSDDLPGSISLDHGFSPD